MRHFLRTAAAIAFGVVLLAGTAGAADTTDVSLAKEVERYLDQTTLAADGGGATVTLDGPTLKVKSADGTHSIALNGRLMFDWFFMSGDDDVFKDGDSGEGVFDDRDGKFFRRVRLAVKGTVYKYTIFKVQLDFASTSSGTSGKNVVSLKDVYVGLKKLGFIDKIMVGHFKEPMGLEELTSSKYITFMERSQASQFAPSRNDGLAASGYAFEKKMTWALGLFCTTPDSGYLRNNGDYSFTFRLTGVLWEDDETSRMIHVGFGLSYRGDDTRRERRRPAVGTGDRTVNTGTISGIDDIILYNFELAFRYKSVHAAFEVYIEDINLSSGDDPSFLGWYFEIGWFITGEVRPYKGGKWQRVKPINLFHDAPGTGAWQVAYRYDFIDLTDGGISGGEQTIHTFGVNWHWNKNTRIMFNFIFASVEDNDSDGDVTAFAMRFQFDF